MNSAPVVLRYTAFAANPSGGNPAGVVLDASGLSAAQMQEIAAEVGYAETAFVVRPPETAAPGDVGIRYFSPSAEVPFCGHATVATAVALAQLGAGDTFDFDTPVGHVRIDVRSGADGPVARFTSVEPWVADIEDAVLTRLLNLIGVPAAALDPRYPPRLAFAGNIHPVLVLADIKTFDGFVFDPVAMRSLMDDQGWKATVTVLHETRPSHLEARNLFPVGAITEDPATGAAAAAVGAYLRALGRAPTTVTIHQGRHVGRPSLIGVHVPATGGIVVSGTATQLGNT